MSAELSRLDIKIQKAKAIDKVYSSYADKETKTEHCDTFNHNSGTRKIHIEDGSPNASPLPHQHGPVDYVTTSQIQSAMMDMIKLQSAPKPDLDPFSGDPLEYLYFKANFQDIVERSVPDQKGRLIHLIQKTEGESKNLIKHFVHADSSDCYTKAMGLLDKTYGNSHLISCKYLKELRNWGKG